MAFERAAGSRFNSLGNKCRKLKFEALEARQLMALTPELVSDIYPGRTPASSNAQQFLVVGDYALFWADDGVHGVELWRSDGTASGTSLVKDIRQGALGAHTFAGDSGRMGLLDGIAYFAADDGIHGMELWRSDGTADGTFLVTDLTPGGSTFLTSWPNYLGRAGDNLYFTNGAGQLSRLIATDGTPAGTRVLVTSNNRIREGVGAGDTFYFPVNNDGVWKTDGTFAGTMKISNSALPREFKEVNGRLVFIGSTNGLDEELWTSDGTLAGTGPIVEIVPGSGNSDIRNLTVMDDYIYFALKTDATDGVWRTNGTSAGTEKVTDVVGRVGYMSGANGRLYYVVNPPDASPSEQLWRYDVGAGTSLVHNVENYGVRPYAAVGGAFYFGQNEPTHPAGSRLWKTSGELGDAVKLSTVIVDEGVYQMPVALPDRLLFNTQINDEVELWTSDGTTAGTRLVEQINPGVPESSNPEELTAVGEKLFFKTTSPQEQLWVSGGAAANTKQLAVTEHDHGYPDFPTFSELAAFNGKLYFNYDLDHPNLYPGDFEFASSDGTPSGTGIVKDLDPRTYELCDDDGDCGIQRWPRASRPLEKTVVNGVLYFSASNVAGRELWRSDGSADGTVMIADLFPGDYQYCSPWNPEDCETRPSSSTPEQLTPFQEKLFFTAQDAVHGRELWLSDGSANGTRLLKDIRSGLEDGGISILAADASYLYFISDDGVSGAELWRTDGTEAGTILLRDIRAGRSGAAIEGGAILNDDFYFIAATVAGFPELWRSDGTPAGTILVQQLPTNSNATRFTSHDQGIYFGLDLPTGKTALWTSNGTANGTSEVMQFEAGGIREFQAANGRLFFAASDGASGEELWTTNGTQGGTRLVADIFEGSASATPRELTVIGDVLYFSAEDRLNGRELWKLTVEDPAKPGDTNGDGRVDLQDLNNVRNNFGGQGLGDTDVDGDVDLNDLNVVLNNFGAGIPAPVAISPSPALGTRFHTPDNSSAFELSRASAELVWLRAWEELASDPWIAPTRGRTRALLRLT